MKRSLCALAGAVGEVELCSGDRCAFWESGGAVVDDGCAIERTGLAAQVRLDPALAESLLELRARLAAAVTPAERGHANALARRLLPPGLHD